METALTYVVMTGVSNQSQSTMAALRAGGSTPNDDQVYVVQASNNGETTDKIVGVMQPGKIGWAKYLVLVQRADPNTSSPRAVFSNLVPTSDCIPAHATYGAFRHQRTTRSRTRVTMSIECLMQIGLAQAQPHIVAVLPYIILAAVATAQVSGKGQSPRTRNLTTPE